MPMGVSGQAGKAKPVTGVLLREGTDISRDSKSGNVLAEILVQKKGSSDAEDFMAVVTSFQSPWPLGMSCQLSMPIVRDDAVIRLSKTDSIRISIFEMDNDPKHDFDRFQLQLSDVIRVVNEQFNFCLTLILFNFFFSLLPNVITNLNLHCSHWCRIRCRMPRHENR